MRSVEKSVAMRDKGRERALKRLARINTRTHEWYHRRGMTVPSWLYVIDPSLVRHWWRDQFTSRLKIQPPTHRVIL